MDINEENDLPKILVLGSKGHSQHVTEYLWNEIPDTLNWKAKYGGMSLSEVKRMKELEEENRRLKQMYANLSLEHEVLKDIIEKKLSK